MFGVDPPNHYGTIKRNGIEPIVYIKLSWDENRRVSEDIEVEN